jgi:hypothetical protein
LNKEGKSEHEGRVMDESGLVGLFRRCVDYRRGNHL